MSKMQVALVTASLFSGIGIGYFMPRPGAVLDKAEDTREITARTFVVRDRFMNHVFPSAVRGLTL